jgi:hypothetical protein
MSDLSLFERTVGHLRTCLPCPVCPGKDQSTRTDRTDRAFGANKAPSGLSGRFLEEIYRLDIGHSRQAGHLSGLSGALEKRSIGRTDRTDRTLSLESVRPVRCPLVTRTFGKRAAAYHRQGQRTDLEPLANLPKVAQPTGRALCQVYCTV